MADDDEEDTSKHPMYDRNKEAHNDSGGYDGGSCCSGHESQYLENNSCAYRWQGCKRALGEDKQLYGDLTAGYSSPSPERAEELRDAGLLVGAMGRKKLAAAGHEYRRVRGEPFKTAFSPWTNQVHHLVPNAVLEQAILETSSDYIRVQDAIVRGLLKFKYNINLWKNMMILPTEDRIGCRVSLPSHLGSHNDYSAEVLPKVMQILRPYKAVVRAIKNNKEHPKVKVENIVSKLDALGVTLHGAVIAMRPLVKGRCERNDKADVGINTFAKTVKTKLGL